MTNPRILKVLREAVAENRNEQLFLIEDIIKAKKLLFGFGYKEHNEFAVPLSAGKLFDTLYDQPIDELQKLNKSLELQINQHLKLSHEAV